MVAPGGAGLLWVSRGPDQLQESECVPVPREGPLAADAAATEPDGPNRMGPNHSPCGGLPAGSAYPSPLAEGPLRRPTPKVGARCVNHARRDLCGGGAAMRIPTAMRTISGD